MQPEIRAVPRVMKLLGSRVSRVPAVPSARLLTLPSRAVPPENSSATICPYPSRSPWGRLTPRESSQSSSSVMPDWIRWSMAGRLRDRAESWDTARAASSRAISPRPATRPLTARAAARPPGRRHRRFKNADAGAAARASPVPRKKGSSRGSSSFSPSHRPRNAAAKRRGRFRECAIEYSF